MGSLIRLFSPVVVGQIRLISFSLANGPGIYIKALIHIQPNLEANYPKMTTQQHTLQNRLTLGYTVVGTTLKILSYAIHMRSPFFTKKHLKRHEICWSLKGSVHPGQVASVSQCITERQITIYSHIQGQF